MDKDALLAKLQGFEQEHLLDFWEELDEPARQRLKGQIEQVDIGLVAALYQGDEVHHDWAELAKRAEPPSAIRADAVSDDEACRIRSLGTAALRAGRVGMILVAGGQGSRLGFHHPKGMFPLGPVSRRTLFQILVDRLRAVARQHDTRLPLFLMTSPATHKETVKYFSEQQRCGLDEEDLTIFCQGVMPAVDAATGKILRASRGTLSLSPDGHGGMLNAFANSGCLAKARQQGIDLLFYGQVDNPLLQVCDPWLLGCHLSADSQLTTQVVRKTNPDEKVGNVVQIDGRTRIIEYSDLPADAASQRNADGSLRLWAGNMAVHVFDRTFLERMVAASDNLPFHRARKKVRFIDAQGELVRPQKPNAVKFERFIFDLLPAAERAIVVETAKEDAFAPVKNVDGSASDTPHDAQQAMIRQHTGMLRAAGVQVSDGVAVEVNPLWALDADEVARKIEPGMEVREPTYFDLDP